MSKEKIIEEILAKINYHLNELKHYENYKVKKDISEVIVTLSQAYSLLENNTNKKYKGE